MCLVCIKYCERVNYKSEFINYNSQQNQIMRKQAQDQDEDDFEILLSKEDYQQLKSWEGKYHKLLNQFKTKQQVLWAQKMNVQEMLGLKQRQFSKLIDQKKLSINCILQTHEDIKLQLRDFNLTSSQVRFVAYAVKNVSQINSDNSLTILVQMQKQLNQYIKSVFKQIKEILGQKESMLLSLQQQNQKMNNQLELSIKNKLSCQSHNQELQQELATEKQCSNGELYNLKCVIQKFERQCNTLRSQNQILNQTNLQFVKQNCELQDELKEYQEHISILRQSIKAQSRSKVDQGNRRKSHTSDSKKTSNPINSTNSKFQKEDYIKETLIQYAREIKKNLFAIGNLSQQQIRQIGASELNTLIKFIKQLEEDFQ